MCHALSAGSLSNINLVKVKQLIKTFKGQWQGSLAGMCLPWALSPQLTQDKSGYSSPELAMVFRDRTEMWPLPTTYLL